MKYVQIIDDVVVSEFSCPQDEKAWPGAQTVEDDDERYIKYVEKLSSIANVIVTDSDS